MIGLPIIAGLLLQAVLLQVAVAQVGLTYTIVKGTFKQPLVPTQWPTLDLAAFPDASTVIESVNITLYNPTTSTLTTGTLS